MRSPAAPYIPQGVETASVGTAPFATFSADPRFAADGLEPNAVAKAYWPLVRRITPRADFREHVACGVMDWRAAPDGLQRVCGSSSLTWRAS